jgi:hypothetical protein
MNVADQFGEIGIFLAENGLIAILKKLTMPTVPPVKGNRMTREKPGHDPMKGDPGLEQQMSVIGEECPCIAGGMGVGEYLPHSFDEAIFVDIIAEDQSPLDTPDDDVMEHAFGIETGMTRHGQSYQTEAECVNSYLLIYGRPLGLRSFRHWIRPIRVAGIARGFYSPIIGPRFARSTRGTFGTCGTTGRKEGHSQNDKDGDPVK